MMLNPSKMKRNRASLMYNVEFNRHGKKQTKKKQLINRVKLAVSESVIIEPSLAEKKGKFLFDFIKSFYYIFFTAKSSLL